MKKECSSCGRMMNNVARGHCRTCYAKGRASGELMILHPPGQICSVAGCGKKMNAKGLCHRHYMQQKRDYEQRRYYCFRARYKQEWPEYWLTSAAFIADTGRCPGKNFRLRKVDLKKPISKGNIHWAPPVPVKTRASENMPEYQRQLRHLRQYNLTPDQYEELSRQHGGLCAICSGPGKKFKGRKEGLVIDHCHKSGAVRGLLCTTCNTAIGHLSDDIGKLRSAIVYLQKWAQSLRLVAAE
jgi:hypothetical protein